MIDNYPNIMKKSKINAKKMLHLDLASDIDRIRKAVWIICLTVLLSAFSGDKIKILIIGDSISIGYTPFVQEALSDRVTVVHNPGNARNTGYALGRIREWITGEDYDIIQFNWGLWDMKGMHMGTNMHTLDEYRTNLDSLVRIMKASTQARLIFVTTSYVPENAGVRWTEDPPKYNAVARKVMEKHSIPVNDIYEQSALIHEKHGRAPNNVHYTSEGYREISRLIISFLENEMKKIHGDI